MSDTIFVQSDAIFWSPGKTLEGIEREIISRAFAHYKQNKAKTAQSLGIAVRTLEAKLEKYYVKKTEETKAADEQLAARKEFLARCRGTNPGATGAQAHAMPGKPAMPPMVPAQAEDPVAVPVPIAADVAAQPVAVLTKKAK